jgi:hypothetical protein
MNLLKEQRRKTKPQIEPIKTQQLARVWSNEFRVQLGKSLSRVGCEFAQIHLIN